MTDIPSLQAARDADYAEWRAAMLKWQKEVEQHISLRDTFAAAALPLCTRNGRNAEQISASAYKLADAMLRERANHPASTPQVPRKSTNHDAAPAARAEESMKEPSGSSTGEPGGEPESTTRTGNLWSPLENPKPDEILLKAVIGVAWDEDLRQAVVKIGDGKTAWKDLPRLMPYTPDPHATPTEGTVPGEGSVPSSSTANEPVAWAALLADGRLLHVYSSEEIAVRWGRANGAASTVPLYRSPPAAWQLVHENERLRDEVARLRLTPEENRAVGWAAQMMEVGSLPRSLNRKDAETLRKMLDRLGGKR